MRREFYGVEEIKISSKILISSLSVFGFGLALHRLSCNACKQQGEPAVFQASS